MATILTGLLSFMLSDEMTTGSVTSTDAEKRNYAARSHGWNIQQKRFREAFSEYCTPTARDVPNMAQKERGVSPAPPATSSLPPPTTTTGTPVSLQPQPVQPPTASASDKAVSRTPNGTSSPGDSGAQGWAASLRQIVWEKWRWGVVLALALVVSRLSSSN